MQTRQGYTGSIEAKGRLRKTNFFNGSGNGNVNKTPRGLGRATRAGKKGRGEGWCVE